MEAREERLAVGDASLYLREIGRGEPIIVLHGGPDFDQGYLQPDLDRLKDAYRLVYYDQRGRGRSADRVRPEDVTLASELDDLDRVRRHTGLEAPTLLGHSWGTVLALHYALRDPSHVSRLILMNPAPASTAGLATLRKAYAAQLGAGMKRQDEIKAGAAYRAGAPEAVAARYRIHFEFALVRPADYERLMTTMKSGFVRQGREGILKARAIEDRLMQETWAMTGYDLLPKLRSLRVPTLVIVGDHDFIPPEIAKGIARAIPNAKLVTIKDCGHFAYLERLHEVRRAFDEFFERSGAKP